MIKIEKLLGTASVMLNGKPHPVYLAQVFDDKVLASLVVHTGTVVYSVDESHIVEVSAPQEPALVVRPTTTKIIKPAPRGTVKQVVTK